MMPLRKASLAAIAFTLAATCLFAIMDTTTKYVVQTVPVLMALWARYFLQALISSLWLWPTHGRALLRTRRPWLQTLRGLSLVASTLFAILSVRFMPVGEFVAIIMLVPVIVTLISATLFRERVRPAQWLFLLVGFAGVMLIIEPAQPRFGWNTLFPLACVVASVAYQLSSSHLSRTEPASTVHFLSMCIGAIAASLLLPWGWSTVDSGFMWLLMVAMGAMGAVSHFLLALAYQRAPATEVVPYMYSQVGFAVLFGWIVFGELPGTLAGAGIVLIILSGLVNAWQLRLRLNVRQQSQSRPL